MARAATEAIAAPAVMAEARGVKAAIVAIVVPVVKAETGIADLAAKAATAVLAVSVRAETKAPRPSSPRRS